MSDDAIDESAVDERDERLARVLAVPPLDDITRRRLVRTALEQGERTARRPRYAAIASVAAAVVVGGLIGWLLVRQPNEPSTTTAQRAPSATNQKIAPSSSSAQPNAAAPSAEAGPVTPLGDLGDVTDPNRLRTQVQTAFSKAPGPEDQSVVAGIPCETTSPPSVGLVAFSAIGTGTYRSNPTTVFIGTSTAEDGRALAVVVRQSSCQLVATVPLPS